MLKKLVTQYQQTLGPGLMFAAVAVGVSHLVQSTRAGANYGLTLSLLIVFTCLIKYPAFRFGSDYATASGKSLLRAYKHQGRFTQFIFLLGFPLDMFVASAAVVLVTTGVFKNVLNVSVGDVQLSFIILVCAAGLLISGRYRLVENVVKLIVVLFSVLTLVAASLTVPELNWQSNDLTGEIVFDTKTYLFMIAIAGWMPTGVSVSVYQSFWVCEKAKSVNQSLKLKDTQFDFNLGYFGTIILALCFVLMGTAFIYNAGIETSPSPSGFAAQLIDMFTQVIGEWARLLIAIAALAVMISTVIANLDACPRVATAVVHDLLPASRKLKVNFQTIFTIVQILGASLILVLFLKSFKTFIDFATSVAFVTAPLLATFNHRAMYSDEVPPDQRPGKIMQIWSLAGIVVMFSVAVFYGYLSFFQS
ncbi:MAG: divalent metal cation transporter [Gammaproteobacteria bacterium]|nr:divalent metal cation transporter [Gammaproteobacteria bacterium]